MRFQSVIEFLLEIVRAQTCDISTFLY